MNCTHFQHVLDCGQFSDLLMLKWVGADAVTGTDVPVCLPTPVNQLWPRYSKGVKVAVLLTFSCTWASVNNTPLRIPHQSEEYAMYANTLWSSTCGASEYSPAVRVIDWSRQSECCCVCCSQDGRACTYVRAYVHWDYGVCAGVKLKFYTATTSQA